MCLERIMPLLLLTNLREKYRCREKILHLKQTKEKIWILMVHIIDHIPTKRDPITMETPTHLLLLKWMRENHLHEILEHGNKAKSKPNNSNIILQLIDALGLQHIDRVEVEVG